MLGPLEVQAGSGEMLEVGEARLRTLLIMLALRPGRLVPASQPPDEHQVLGAGKPLVHRRVLPGQPGELPDLVGLAHRVAAADRRVPAVRPHQRGQDPDRGGLPRAVGA